MKLQDNCLNTQNVLAAVERETNGTCSEEVQGDKIADHHHSSFEADVLF